MIELSVLMVSITWRNQLEIRRYLKLDVTQHFVYSGSWSIVVRLVSKVVRVHQRFRPFVKLVLLYLWFFTHRHFVGWRNNLFRKLPIIVLNCHRLFILLIEAPQSSRFADLCITQDSHEGLRHLQILHMLLFMSIIPALNVAIIEEVSWLYIRKHLRSLTYFD